MNDFLVFVPPSTDPSINVRFENCFITSLRRRCMGTGTSRRGGVRIDELVNQSNRIKGISGDG